MSALTAREPETNLNFYPKPVHVEFKARGTTHDLFLRHGFNPNPSQWRQCEITIKYIPIYVRIN